MLWASAAQLQRGGLQQDGTVRQTMINHRFVIIGLDGCNKMAIIISYEPLLDIEC